MAKRKTPYKKYNLSKKNKDSSVAVMVFLLLIVAVAMVFIFVNVKDDNLHKKITQNPKNKKMRQAENAENDTQKKAFIYLLGQVEIVEDNIVRMTINEGEKDEKLVKFKLTNAKSNDKKENKFESMKISEIEQGDWIMVDFEEFIEYQEIDKGKVLMATKISQTQEPGQE